MRTLTRVQIHVSWQNVYQSTTNLLKVCSDGLAKETEHIGFLSCEAYVMFSKNTTAEWLKCKSRSEVETLLSSARKEARSVQKQFQERHHKIMEECRRCNQERMEREAAARRSTLQELERYTADVVYHGFWQNTAQVDNMLATLKTKKLQMETSKAQLRLREHVLKQHTGDKIVYRFPKDGRPLTVCDLAAHLKSLLVHALALPVDNNAACFLVGQRVKHRFQEEEGGGNAVQRWHCGKVISQVEVLRRALSFSLPLSLL